MTWVGLGRLGGGGRMSQARRQLSAGDGGWREERWT